MTAETRLLGYMARNTRIVENGGLIPKTFHVKPRWAWAKLAGEMTGREHKAVEPDEREIRSWKVAGYQVVPVSIEVAF